MLTIPSAYQFTPKDLTGTSLTWWRQMVQLNGAQASFSALTQWLVVPNDQVLLLTHVDTSATPGGAQNFVNSFFTENDAIGTPVGNIWTSFSGSAAAVNGLGNAGPLNYLIRGGHTIRAFATFDAGAVSNLIQWTLAGWLIPRGNIQFTA